MEWNAMASDGVGVGLAIELLCTGSRFSSDLGQRLTGWLSSLTARPEPALAALTGIADVAQRFSIQNNYWPVLGGFFLPCGWPTEPALLRVLIE